MKRSQGEDAVSPTSRPRRSRCDKFEAFGNFVVSSLTDLPERKALELLEKFTGDIVQALLQSSEAK